MNDSHIQSMSGRGLEIRPCGRGRKVKRFRVVDPAGPGRPECALAELDLHVPERCWRLYSLPSIGLPACTREWLLPQWRPHGERTNWLPEEIRLAVFRQVAGWAFRAAQAAKSRESALLDRIVESTRALAAHRRDVAESNENRDGDIDDPETAACLAGLDRVIAENRRSLPPVARAREEGKEGGR